MVLHYNRRLDRRIPVQVPAQIFVASGRVEEAKCMDLSVRGMTLHTGYVPGEAEVLEVLVSSPGGASVAARPLRVMLQVKRCIQLAPGEYEVGGEIVQVLG